MCVETGSINEALECDLWSRNLHFDFKDKKPVWNQQLRLKILKADIACPVKCWILCWRIQSKWHKWYDEKWRSVAISKTYPGYPHFGCLVLTSSREIAQTHNSQSAIRLYHLLSQFVSQSSWSKKVPALFVHDVFPNKQILHTATTHYRSHSPRGSLGFFCSLPGAVDDPEAGTGGRWGLKSWPSGLKLHVLEETLWKWPDVFFQNIICRYVCNTSHVWHSMNLNIEIWYIQSM